MDEFERKAYRELCIQAVFSIWNQEKQPAHLGEIYHFCPRASKRENCSSRVAVLALPWQEVRGGPWMACE